MAAGGVSRGGGADPRHPADGGPRPRAARAPGARRPAGRVGGARRARRRSPRSRCSACAWAPDKARAWLMRCAEAREAWFGPGRVAGADATRGCGSCSGSPPMPGRRALAALCARRRVRLRRAAALPRRSTARGAAATGREVRRGDRAAGWRGDRAARVAACDELFDGAVHPEGRAAARSTIARKARPGLRRRIAERVRACLDAVREHAGAARAGRAARRPRSTVGRRFALAWDEAKQREGLVDFDDLIRRAAALLDRAELGRLDPLQARPAVRPHPGRRGAGHQRGAMVDHRRADRATSSPGSASATASCARSSWSATTSRRSSASRAPARRTSAPREGRSSPRRWPTRRAMPPSCASRSSARELRRPRPRPLVPHRAAGARFRRRAIAAIGPENFGLDATHPSRTSATSGPGLVTLWNPVDARPDDEEDGEGPETWLSEPERRMADRIAAQVKALVGQLPAGQGRARASPGRATSWCWCASGASWPG